jgi:AcrR family transcriptional regulator
MPWHLDSATRTDEIVRVVQDLIAQSGLSAVTYRAIGARLRLSASTLHDHYPDRTHLLRIVVDRVATRREDQLSDLATMLPEGDDELRLARVWLSLRDRARVEPGLGGVIDLTRDRERGLIGHALDVARPAAPRAGDRQIEVIQALLEGLTSALTVGAEPMTRPRAMELLDLAVTAMLGPVAGPAVGPV